MIADFGIQLPKLSPRPSFEIRIARSLKMHKYPAFCNPHAAIDRRGFTLIEILILIVMAGILLAAIVVPFTTGIRASTKPEMVATAMYLAHQRVEDLMKYNYCNAALNPTALTGYANIAGFSGYQWEWSIYYVNTNLANPGLVTDTGYKMIRVLVTDPMLSTYEVDSVVTRF